MAFGILAVVGLALMATFISGVRATGQSKRLAQSTELSRQVLERTRWNVRRVGPAYLPPGTTVYDGRLPSPTTVTGGVAFPPSPYPTYTLDGQDYTLVVYGQDISPKLKSVRVDVLYGPTGRTTLETHIHL